MSAKVAINGDVKVGKGAVLGLGNYGPPGIKTNTIVNGDINANRPLDLYLSGITVHGNVTSNGGGQGTSQFLNFPTKDDTIDGNLIMNDWQGGWIGALRDTVGGNLVLTNNASLVHQTPVGCDDNDPNPANHCTGFATGADPDSTEVATNTIAGNLICYGNTPPPSSATAAANPTPSQAKHSANAPDSYPANQGPTVRTTISTARTRTTIATPSIRRATQQRGEARYGEPPVARRPTSIGTCSRAG